MACFQRTDVSDKIQTSHNYFISIGDGLTATILTLLGSIGLVFISSLLSVNALEFLGCHMKLGNSFVGAVLSPLFTSLPELIVVLVAVFSNLGTVGSEIGIGTIFGEPFMASTLSYGLVGIAVILGFLAKKRAGTTLVINRNLALPYIFILVLFPLTLIPGLVHFAWVRYFFGFFFLTVFVIYMRLMYRRRMAEPMDECETLTFSRFVPKGQFSERFALILQILMAVGLLFFGSRYLVSSVANMAQDIKVSPLGLALILVPAATAIPETITALIWGYRGKDTLSVGSLVGEKILFSTFYPALGLFLTPWILDIHAVMSVIVTTVASLIMLYFILKQRLPWYILSFGIILFVAYGILVFATKI
jgi:cation:H+ antiporter